jgi:hypothetical protein
MKHQEFIQKLKTFPPTHTARFYCPTDKTYYYYNHRRNIGGMHIYCVSKNYTYHNQVTYYALIFWSTNHIELPFQITEIETGRNFQLI